MTNLILLLLGYIAIMIIAVKGQNYFAKRKRVREAKQRAQNRFRWSDGKFSKVKTYADMYREIKVAL